MNLNERQKQLWEDLRALHYGLRDSTREKFGRVNPFYEDLFDWKERGHYWTGEDNVTIYNSTTIVGDVRIGKNTWIGPFCALDGMGGLEIGEHCSIATGTIILTHDTVKWTVSGGRAAREYSPVKIGNYCFLAVGVTVARGVTIGDHSVVAAGAVVVRDVPSYSLAVGAPARVVARIHIGDDGAVEYEYLDRDGR